MGPSKSIQCNLYLLKDPPKHKQTQTVAAFRRKSQSCQTQNVVLEKVSNKSNIKEEPKDNDKLIVPDVLNFKDVSTQCHTNAPPIKKKLRTSATQILIQTTSIHCQTDNLPRKNSPLFNLLFPILESTLYFQLLLKVSTNFQNQQIVCVTNPSFFGLLGYDIDPIELVFNEKGHASVIIPFCKIENIDFSIHDDLKATEMIHSLLFKVKGIGFVVCPGIKPDSTIDTTISSLVVHELPFLRYQSNKCAVFYSRAEAGCLAKAKCPFCTTTTKAIAMKRKRSAEETPEHLAKRLNSESNYSFFRLNLNNQKIRLTALRKEKRVLRMKVEKLESKLSRANLYLNESQCKEMEDDDEQEAEKNIKDEPVSADESD